MRVLIILLVLLGHLFFMPGKVLAQEGSDTAKLWRIELLNENEYIGTIVSRDDKVIVFNSNELGIISIKVKDIRSMEVISRSRLIDGQFWYENPQAARYFWAPNGFGLRKGEGYYQNVWVFFNQVSYGITDHVSIGGGFMPLFLLGGGPTPLWITPKVSVPIAEKFHMGAGALIGTILGEDVDGAFGIAYGTATAGTRDINVTFGLGYGFAGGEWANYPTFNLSAMYRVGRRGYILTENYFIDAGSENLTLISFGGRSVWKKLSLDYGLVIPVISGEGVEVAVPWLGVVIPFGEIMQYGR